MVLLNRFKIKISIMKLKQTVIVVLLVLSCTLYAQKSNLLEKLQKNEKLDVTKIETIGAYQESYLIMITQPVDHNDKNKGVFKQRIWLNHIDEKAPVVMITEGYSAKRNYVCEIAKELKANQLIVEHRYFEESTPKEKDWQFLTVNKCGS